MLRPVSLLPALVAATAIGWTALAGTLATDPAAAATAAGADGAPLTVTIDSLSPSALPRAGRIRVTGEITNDSEETWRTINVYPFVSSTPMTTAAELEDAAHTDAEAYVGERIVEPAPYDEIDELAPGDSASYTISVPRKRLPIGNEPGVYWFGVHALGEDADGRLPGADGRARTFLPSVGQQATPVDTALVVPIRHGIRRHADGRLAGVAGWADSLDRDGELGSMVDLGAAAGSRPITWLVDPAVPDAVRSLVAGNPARSLAPTISDSGGDSGGDDGGDDGDGSGPTASEQATPDDDSSASPEDSGDGTEEDGDSGSAESADPTQQAAATAGAAWLDRLRSALGGSEVLSLPYGDLDVAGAAAHSPRTYDTARERSGTTLSDWGTPTAPAVSSPDGYLSPDAVTLIDRDTTALVSSRVLGDDTTTVTRSEGRTLVALSDEAVAGGPGPDDPLAPVAFRQRLLSEAALRTLDPTPQPLVVMVPTAWRTTSPTDFFEGLDQPWVRLTTVGAVAQQPGGTIEPDRLDYPEEQSQRELGASSFDAARDLMRSGETLQNLLTLNDQVAATVRDEALTDVSYSDRSRPLLARASARQSRAWIQRRLRAVHVEAPRAVILSSGSGRFSATLSNALDEPVTVQLDAVTDPPLHVSVPADTIDIAAGSRTSVLLNASSSAIGIRNATLVLSDSDGVPLGSADQLPIRSNRVSNVIWLILGTGVALLFGAIVVRLVRRLRVPKDV